MKRKLNETESQNIDSKQTNSTANVSFSPYLHTLIIKSNQTYNIQTINFIILKCDISSNRKIIESPYWCLPIERIDKDTTMFPPELSQDEAINCELTNIVNEWLLSDNMQLETNGCCNITFSLYPIHIAPPKIIETFYNDTTYTSNYKATKTIQKYRQIEGNIDRHELLVATINGQVLVTLPLKRLQDDFRFITGSAEIFGSNPFSVDLLDQNSDIIGKITVRVGITLLSDSSKLCFLETNDTNKYFLSLKNSFVTNYRKLENEGFYVPNSWLCKYKTRCMDELKDGYNFKVEEIITTNITASAFCEHGFIQNLDNVSLVSCAVWESLILYFYPASTSIPYCTKECHLCPDVVEAREKINEHARRETFFDTVPRLIKNSFAKSSFPCFEIFPIFNRTAVLIPESWFEEFFTFRDDKTLELQLPGSINTALFVCEHSKLNFQPYSRNNGLKFKAVTEKEFKILNDVFGVIGPKISILYNSKNPSRNLARSWDDFDLVYSPEVCTLCCADVPSFKEDISRLRIKPVVELDKADSDVQDAEEKEVGSSATSPPQSREIKELNRLKKLVMTGSNFFHANTFAPLTTLDEFEYDSDKETDAGWLIETQINEFSNFSSVTEKDRLLVRKWNNFLTFEFTTFSVEHIVNAIDFFVQKYASWLLDNNLQSNYLNLILSLWKTGGITNPKTISENMTKLYSYNYKS